MRRRLNFLCLLASLALRAAAADVAAPEALTGRFVDAQGRVLDVESGKGRLKVYLGLKPNADEGLAVWAEDSLIVAWSSGAPRGLADAGAGGGWRIGDQNMTTFAAGADAGRLTLAVGERVFVREGSTPWWRLKPATRAELTARLSSTEGRAWILGGFTPWYEKTYAGTPVKEPEAIAEWTFGQFDAKQRMSLLALYAKMRADGVWRFIGPVVNVGRSGEIDFFPAVMEEDMHAGLAKLGFADVYGASHGADWGVRDRRSGVYLHFRGRGLVNAHIDFHNPTTADEAVAHIYHDLEHWAEEHTALRVAAEVRQQVPVEVSPD